jgi:hypothetical protein
MRILLLYSFSIPIQACAVLYAFIALQYNSFTCYFKCLVSFTISFTRTPFSRISEIIKRPRMDLLSFNSPLINRLQWACE